MVMLDNRLHLVSIVEFLRRSCVDRGTNGSRVVVGTDLSKQKVYNVSSQSQVCGVLLVDPWQEALQEKAGWYTILGHGEEVPLSDEELCEHSQKTMQSKVRGYQPQP
jgi:hypothetical protein